MKNIKSERGQALIIFALAAIALFGIVGLAIDGSAKFSDRRHAQNAADTAALAAALAKVNTSMDPTKSNTPPECPPSSGLPSDVCAALIAAGKNQAGENGYDNNLVQNTVEVFSPPISGYYTGDNNYVQVIITSHVNTTFSRVVGIEQTHNVVEAVALTKEGGPLFDGAALISVDPSPNCSGGNGNGGGSVDVSGNSTVTLHGGGIFVNSSASCGYSQTSCSVSLVIDPPGGIMSAGSNIYMKDNNTNTDCNPGVPTDTTHEQYVVPDEIYMPDEPIECSQTASAFPLGGQDWQITPGYYLDFPQNGIINNNRNIYMAPGVYCVDGPLDWHGGTFDLLDGTSGVTIYIKSGHDFKFNTNSPIMLNASNSGDYEGFLIILDGTHTSIEDCSITGGDYLDMEGTIYAPYCDITINGNSTSNADFNAQVIGWDLKVNGNNIINFYYDPNSAPQIKRRIGLMK